MWFLFQILIMTLIIGSNGAYRWAPRGGAFPWWCCLQLLRRAHFRFG